MALISVTLNDLSTGSDTASHSLKIEASLLPAVGDHFSFAPGKVYLDFIIVKKKIFVRSDNEYHVHYEAKRETDK